jgi:hypothetical protein
MESLRTEFSLIASSSRPLSAFEISKTLGKEKSAVNRELYALLKAGKVTKDDGTPPRWSSGNTSDEKYYVLIDVDNSHCLKEACAYASENTQIIAFASPAYNHYIPTDVPNVVFEKVKSDLPSYADVKFIIKMVQICERSENNSGLVFLVVSQDKILSTTLEILLEGYKDTKGLKVECIKDGWEGLKMYLE